METKAIGDLPLRLAHGLESLVTYLVNRDTLIELAVITFLALIAWALSQRQRAYLTNVSSQHVDYVFLSKVWKILKTISFPLTWLILQWLVNLVSHHLGWREGIMIVTASLLTAWVIIRVASEFFGNSLVSRSIAVIAWTVAALNILGWLHPTVELLNSIGFTLGDSKITLLTVFKLMIPVF